MKSVFVDTSAFFAHLVAEDASHGLTRAAFEKAFREQWDLVTTNAVVSETYTLLRKRARNGREGGLAFLDDVEAGMCLVVREAGGSPNCARSASVCSPPFGERALPPPR